MSTGSIFPLAVGNRWDFLTFRFDSLANVTSVRRDSILIVGDTVVNGVQWFCGPDSYLKSAYRSSAKGILTRIFTARSDGKEALMLKYPAKVGDVFGYPVSVLEGQTISFTDTLDVCTVKCTDTLIFVPAGQFQCYLYQIRFLWPAGYSELFLSPSHGWIKMDDYFMSKGGVPKYVSTSRRAESILVK